MIVFDHVCKIYPGGVEAVKDLCLEVAAGETVQLSLVVTNHSPQPKELNCRPILPSHWRDSIEPQTVQIPPHQEASVEFALHLPAEENLLPAGAHQARQEQNRAPARAERRIVIPMEVTYDGRQLGHFREAILTIQGDSSCRTKDCIRPL